MKLYSVSDKYIEYLRKYESRVYDNKLTKRKHDRKYLGVVLKINNYNYFIPLTSPKNPIILMALLEKIHLQLLESKCNLWIKKKKSG